MINIYTHVKAMATAISASTAIRDFCVTNFGRGCLVQVDDKAEDPVMSDEAPWIVLLVAPPGELGGEASDSRMSLVLTAGVCAGDQNAPPASSTERTAAANGLKILGIGEKAEELMRLAVGICKACNLGVAIRVRDVSPSVDGSSFFPLQTAQARLIVSEAQNMSTF